MSLLPYEVGLASKIFDSSLLRIYFVWQTLLLDKSRLLRCGIVYMVSGRKKMNAFLWFQPQGKQPRYNKYFLLESSLLSEYAWIYTFFIVVCCMLNALKASLICLLFFLFIVGHQKNFETPCKRKFEAARSDGCKVSSCKSNDCTQNNCSSGLALLVIILSLCLLESLIFCFLYFSVCAQAIVNLLILCAD